MKASDRGGLTPSSVFAVEHRHEANPLRLGERLLEDAKRKGRGRDIAAVLRAWRTKRLASFAGHHHAELGAGRIAGHHEAGVAGDSD